MGQSNPKYDGDGALKEFEKGVKEMSMNDLMRYYHFHCLLQSAHQFAYDDIPRSDYREMDRLVEKRGILCAELEKRFKPREYDRFVEKVQTAENCVNWYH